MGKNHSSAFLLWGLGLGALGGLLLAPQAGYRTRRRISSKATKAWGMVAGQYAAGKRNVERSAKALGNAMKIAGRAGKFVA